RRVRRPDLHRARAMKRPIANANHGVWLPCGVETTLQPPLSLSLAGPSELGVGGASTPELVGLVAGVLGAVVGTGEGLGRGVLADGSAGGAPAVPPLFGSVGS